MLGAYITYWMFALFGVDPFLSNPLSMGALFVMASWWSAASSTSSCGRHCWSRFC